MGRVRRHGNVLRHAEQSAEASARAALAILDAARDAAELCKLLDMCGLTEIDLYIGVGLKITEIPP